MGQAVKAVIFCREPVQAHKALTAVLWPQIKSHLVCGGGALVVTVKPEKRSDDQNALLHAALSDVARQCQWAGKSWSVENWKRLMTAAWCRANAQGVEIVPAIDGQGFDVLYQRTSTLTKAECADLCEFLFAWGTEKGVAWSGQHE